MIERITVRDFILVEELEMVFTPGFNVLTGETGAGKSILVGALSVLCGGKGTGEMVRTGAEEALVAGEFRVGEHPQCLAWLAEREISPDEGVVLVRRTLRTNSRGTIYMQSTPLSRADLEDFSSLLIDLHSQHEHQSLFRESSHRELLDRYAGLEDRVARLGETFSNLTKLQGTLQDMETREVDRQREIDYLQFAISEIDAAAVNPAEMTSLEQERDRMLQFEKLAEHLEHAHALLEGAGGEDVVTPGIEQQLRQLRQEIRGAARLDGSVEEIADRLDTLFFELEDTQRELNQYRSALVYDPARLDEIEERLATLRELSRKYGGSLEAVLQFRSEAESSLEKLTHAEESKEELRQRIRQTEQLLLREAREVHDERSTHAVKLQEQITAVLHELAMGSAAFVLSVEPRTNEAGKLICGIHGADKVRFLITTNPGEPPRPLSKIASGGELSRVMLAIKTVLAAADNLRALLFDEIDTGIGGAVALAMASHMRSLSDHGQVICITHLATLAVHGDNHIAVTKETRDQRTVTRVRRLTGEDRVQEVARMLAGDGGEQQSLEHARALLVRYRRANDGQNQ